MSPGEFIVPESLPAHLSGGGRQVVKGEANFTLDQAIDQAERQILLETLDNLNWNRQATARSLGISRTTLFNKMRRFELTDPRRAPRAGEPGPERGRTAGNALRKVLPLRSIINLRGGASRLYFPSPQPDSPASGAKRAKFRYSSRQKR